MEQLWDVPAPDLRRPPNAGSPPPAGVPDAGAAGLPGLRLLSRAWSRGACAPGLPTGWSPDRVDEAATSTAQSPAAAGRSAGGRSAQT